MSTLTILVGLPGSGKSTLANRLQKDTNSIIVSSDAIRAELGDVNDQENNTKVFEIAHKRTRDYLKDGYDVIFDATNISRKSRRAVLANAPKGTYKKCIMVYSSIEECIERNKHRDRALRKCLNKWALGFHGKECIWVNRQDDITKYYWSLGNEIIVVKLSNKKLDPW